MRFPKSARSRIRPDDYPDLFRPQDWKIVTVEFRLLSRLPADRMIANANLIPRDENGWVVIRKEDGERTVPGGTREPGESLSSQISS